MQKKARNSFLLGMIITLIVCAIIGVILYIAVIGPENKASKERSVEIKGKIGIPQVGGIFWKRVWRIERRVESLAWAKTGVILPSEASEGNDKWGRERRIESETPVISLMVIWMERRVLLSKSFHISSVLSAYW